MFPAATNSRIRGNVVVGNPPDSAVEFSASGDRRGHLGSVGARQQQQLFREHVSDGRQRAVSGGLDDGGAAEAWKLTRIRCRRWVALVAMAGVLCALARARAQSANADAPLHDLGGVAALQAMFEHDRRSNTNRSPVVSNLTGLYHCRPVGAARASRTQPTGTAENLRRVVQHVPGRCPIQMVSGASSRPAGVALLG